MANSTAVEDDYYVRFEGHNDQDGEGSWVECAKPGVKISFDPETMPLQIKRKQNGDFKVGYPNWDNRLVGDMTAILSHHL